jgi:hypothetical protein
MDLEIFCCPSLIISLCPKVHKVIQFMINSSQPQQPSQQEISSDESANENDTEATPETEPEPEVDSGEDDLASLSEPVPLRPKEI